MNYSQEYNQQLLYHYQNFNLHLDSRIAHIEHKMGKLNAELKQLDQLMALPAGKRQRLVMECKVDLYDATKPLKIMNIERQRVSLQSVHKNETQSQVYRPNQIEEMDTAEDANSYNEEEHKNIEKYIGNKSLLMGRYRKELDLSQILVDPSQINYGNNELLQHQDDEDDYE